MLTEPMNKKKNRDKERTTERKKKEKKRKIYEWSLVQFSDSRGR